MKRSVEPGKYYVLQDESVKEDLQSEHFEADYWQDMPGFDRIDGGRGGSVKISLGGRAVVLRHYLRGGVVARWLHDQYLWLGRSRTRAWREWEILQKAVELELPVSPPLAICVWRSGLIYRAAIMTAFIANTETLAERLMRTSLKREIWYQLGLLLKKLQHQRFRHADLNANNVLIDNQDRLYIIDFDKARIMSEMGDWQWRPLYRLQRSLNKLDRKHTLHYDEGHWQALMDGYQSTL